MSKQVFWLALGALFCFTGVACQPSADVTKLEGAGASFPAPLYKQWCSDYGKANPDVQVNYQAVGSGAGIQNVVDDVVDFGASDAGMPQEDRDKVEEGVQLIPMTAGSVVLAYNVPGVEDLKLTRQAYVDIFLGKVTKWNDEAIAAANPGVDLPDMPIGPVVRADSSGTTFVFTKHLAAINSEFADKIGVHKLPEWPVGSKAPKNDGVAGLIKQTEGGIGYIEYGFAQTAGLPVASLENKAGKFVAPSIESAQVSLASAEMPEDLVVWVSDPAGEGAYPIVTYTWIICYKTYEDAKTLEALKGFLTFGLTEGQASAEPLGYIPLPEDVVQKCKVALDNITLAN